MKKLLFPILCCLFCISSCDNCSDIPDTTEPVTRSASSGDMFEIDIFPGGAISLQWDYPLGVDHNLPPMYYITLTSSRYGVIYDEILTGHSNYKLGNLSPSHSYSNLEDVSAKVMVGGAGLTKTFKLKNYGDKYSGSLSNPVPDGCNHEYNLYNLRFLSDLKYTGGSIGNLTGGPIAYKIVLDYTYQKNTWIPSGATKGQTVKNVYPGDSNVIIQLGPDPGAYTITGTIKYYTFECNKVSGSSHSNCKHYLSAPFGFDIGNNLVIGQFSEVRE